MIIEGDPGWKWADSLSKSKLMRMLHRGDIPLDMPPKDIYCMHPLFAREVEYNKTWASRVRLCKEKVKAGHKEALEEAKGLAYDRHIFPKTTHNTNGKKHWHGSAAEQIVRNVVEGLFEDIVVDGIDCKAYDRSTMPSKDLRVLYDANPALQLFDYWEVYNHATQEIKKIKYYNYRNLKSVHKMKKRAAQHAARKIKES